MEKKKGILSVLIISIAILGCGDNTTEITTTTGSDIEVTTTGSMDDATIDGMDVAAPKDTSADSQECAPECTDRSCGDDGCGSSCGECGIGSKCDNNGQCVCIPQCDGKFCGPDGCRGQCGSCAESEFCNDGQCETSCVSDKGCSNADQTQCNDDNSGVQNCVEAASGCFKWQDGDACPDNQSCKDGKCCVPQCDGKTCGDNGCDGNCGECAGGQECIDNNCQCVEKQSLKCFILSSKGDSAVHWADSCGNQGELSETCADSKPCTINGCSDGKCTVEPTADGTQCDAGKACQKGECVDCESICNNDPADPETCGQFSGCDCGECTGEKECVAHKCVCSTNTTGICLDGDVYKVNACKTIQELFESCDDGNACTDDSCETMMKWPGKKCQNKAKDEGASCGDNALCENNQCTSCDIICKGLIGGNGNCGEYKGCDCEQEQNKPYPTFGCSGGKQCIDNFCQCVPEKAVACFGAGLYETLDSCGKKGNLVDSCYDANVCTDDTCEDGKCKHTISANDTPCGSNQTYFPAYCQDGACEYDCQFICDKKLCPNIGPEPICYDKCGNSDDKPGVPSTTASCDCGDCVAPLKCNDQNFCECLKYDHVECVGNGLGWFDSCGNYQGATAQNCNDSNQCTIDSCQGNICVNENVTDGMDCGDGKICTTGQCVEKTCEDLCTEVTCTNLPNCDCGYKEQASFACMYGINGNQSLYWVDSCGKKGELKQPCSGSGACTQGGCKDNSCYIENEPPGTPCGNKKVCVVTDPQTNTLSCKDACVDHSSLLFSGQVGCCDHNTGLLKPEGTACGKLNYYKEVKCVDNVPYIAKVSKTCTGKFCDDESSCKGTQAKCDGPIETENLNWVAQEPCPASKPICTPVNTDGKGYTCVQCTSDECCSGGQIRPQGYLCKQYFNTPKVTTYSCSADGVWVIKKVVFVGCNGVTEGCSTDPNDYYPYSNGNYKKCGDGQTCSVSADGKQWQCVVL